MITLVLTVDVLSTPPECSRLSFSWSRAAIGVGKSSPRKVTSVIPRTRLPRRDWAGRWRLGEVERLAPRQSASERQSLEGQRAVMGTTR